MSIQSEVSELLVGAYDLHIHPSPSPFGRALDDFQLLQAADEVGMAGILLKSHYESTAARAAIANAHAGAHAAAYGAIVLNWPVGGLNPYAVNNALKRGAKIVFLPTRDADNSLCFGNMPGDFFDRPGIGLRTEDGKLRPELYDIFDVVRSYGAVLATGHISPQDSMLVCKEGRAHGVRMILTHPEFSRTRINAEGQKELADIGVLIEKCWYNIGEGECTAAEMAAHIQNVGAERCYLSTDRGQGDKKFPAAEMGKFLAALLENGVEAESLHIMTHAVPESILLPS